MPRWMRRRWTMLTVPVVAIAAGLVWALAGRGPSGTQPRLQLQANLMRQATVNQGAPIRFDVTLVGEAGAVGNRWRPWERQIRFEVTGGAPLPWPVEQAGAASSMTAAWDAEEGLRIEEEVRSVVAFGDGTQHMVSFEAPPSVTAAAAPGNYEVRAILEAPVWSVWTTHGPIVSAPVIVEVRQADEQFETSRLASAAAYYLRRGRYADARPLVEQLVHRHPQRPGPQVLLGRVLEGLDDRQGAIDAYARALHLGPAGYEAPADVVERMGRLVRQARVAR